MTFAVNESPTDHSVQPVRSGGASNLRVHSTTVRGVLARLRTAVEQFEQTYLDPLFDRALNLWAGESGSDRQEQLSLISSLADTTLTPEERALNRGLYLSVSSLGLSLLGNLFFPPLRLLSFLGLIYNSRAVYLKAYRDLVREQTITIDVLTAIVNTAYLGGGLLVWGSIAQMSFFFSARMLAMIQDRFTQDMTAAFKFQSQWVWQLIEGEVVQVSVETLQIGDVVVVQAGEVIPVDGTVQEGLALVDQQVLTGEARPVEKSHGDAVLALTLVVSGKIFITVSKTSDETTAGRVGQLLQQTMDLRSQRQLRVTKLTDDMIIPTLLVSAISLPWLGPLRAAALLHIHPHRHLINLGTLSNLSFLLYATRRHILIKDGRSLEVLNRVDTVIFDKTGTLTQTQPQVAAVHPYNGWSVDTLLTYAAAAEQHQDHPIARALLAEAKARQLRLPEVEDATYQAGFGLKVQIDGRRLQIGSIRFIEQAEIEIPSTIHHLCEQSGMAEHSLVIVAVDDQVAGVIELEIGERPEAKAVLDALRSYPQIKDFVVVSGDQERPTAALAKTLGIDSYVAEALPSNKAALIAKLQAEGRTVCFVGDGINDAVALKQANLSVSMRGATAAATETAHVVLMKQDLRQLLSLFEMGQEYEGNQRSLTAAVLTPGIAGALGVFFAGIGLPQMAILDVLDSTLGTAIAMRPWLKQRWMIESTPAQDESATRPK